MRDSLYRWWKWFTCCRWSKFFFAGPGWIECTRCGTVHYVD